MRIKKMLAVLAAISMLASMGISAAAEDETAATTTMTTAEEAVTTAATEATTLTETEITTTAETTADSEKETTVATEENETVEEVSTIATKTYQMGENGDGTPDFHEVKVVLYSDITEDWDETERLSVYVDGTLSNLAGIAVGSAIAGDPESQEYVCNPDNFFAITGVDEIAITAYGVATSYSYDHSSGQFVKDGEVVTTTTTTTSTTTTTTTVTSNETVTEEMLYQIFEEYVAEKKVEYEYTGDISSFLYVPEKQLAYGVYGWSGSQSSDIMCIITKDGVVEQERSDVFHSSILESYYFTCNGIPFVAALVNLYSNGGDLFAVKIYNMESGTPVETNLTGIKVGNVIEPHGYPVTDPESPKELSAYFSVADSNTIKLNGITYIYDINNKKFVEKGSPVQPTVLEIHENDSMTVTGTLSYEWDQINENNNYKHAILTLDTPITVKYMDGEWAGKTETIDSVQIVIEDELAEGTRLKVTGNVMYAHTGHHLRNIVLMDCSYEVLGKNNSKTFNKPSNTTGTPKTGDVATLPAVALGLTMTAAGVAAIIYKKRK